MRILKYNLCTRVNFGTEAKPQWEEVLSAVEMGWNESNEEIAKREAYNGEYIVEEIFQEETEPTQEERIRELEEALELLLTGVTE